MKMNKETKQLLGLSAFASALVLSFAFLVLAVRKKSIVGAILAVASAAGSAVSLGAMLTELFAPDTEGEHVSAACDATEDETELFDAEEAEAAACRVRHILGGKRDGEVVEGAPSVRPAIPQDDEATEADFMA